MSWTPRAGQWVRVRSAAEIAATLDADGCLGGMPFMPEMLQFCGRRMQIQASAHKTCDTIDGPGILALESAVHLSSARCSGEGHGGCQARCLLFWRTEWLEPAAAAPTGELPAAAAPAVREQLERGATRPGSPDGTVYRCQATELHRYTRPSHWYALGLYWQDLRTGNVAIWQALFSMLVAAFNGIQRRRRGRSYPSLHRDQWLERTPDQRLNLKPGELVRVKPKEAILATLDKEQRNRGLSFDREMTVYCGRTARVLDRVERLVNERTGRMDTIRSDCIILEGVVCGGLLSERRRLCPRAIHPYWREIWLERVTEGEQRPTGTPGAGR